MLKVTKEPLENCEILMTVEVDEQQTNKLLKAAAQRVSQQVTIPGFRPGKAPYRMVARRVGEEVVRNEVLEDLSQSVFKQALEQADLEPYAPPLMEDVTWDPLVMKVRVPIEPTVELGDYRAMRLEAAPIELSEAEVDEALERLQEENATWNPVERPAQSEDLATLDVKDRVGNDVIREEENVEYVLAEKDEGDASPDMTARLLGLSAGDKTEYTVTYPDTYDDSRLAGKDVVTSVEVRSVKEKEVYALDDDFAQTVGDFDTLQQLREKLTEDLRQQKQREADSKLAEEALEQLIENAERVEWPKTLEEEEIDQVLEEQDRNLQGSGLSLDTYLSMQKKTREQLREDFRPAVQERVRRSLVLSKLVELEDLSVSGEEVSGQVDRLSLMAGERASEMRQVLTTPANVRHIFNDLLTSKAMDRLLQIVKGEAEIEAEPEPDTAEMLQAEIEPESDTSKTAQAEAEPETAAPVAAEQSQDEEATG